MHLNILMEVSMIRRQVSCMAVWAVGTFGLALAFGLPAISNAVDDANSPGMVATVLTPQLVVNGVELTVKSDGPATQPSEDGKAPADQRLKFEVRAVNKTSAAASGKFKVRMTSVAPVSRGARVLPMATEQWKDSAEFTLAAGETKTYTFTTTSLLPNRMFTISLDSSDNRVAILSLVENQ
jgi:hypothetical protein